MISVVGSKGYTGPALDSFFRHTCLGPKEKFVLVDNDGSFEDTSLQYPEVDKRIPEVPRSFSQNLNAALVEAEREGADLYALNNDLIFSKDWTAPLQGDSTAILSPVSNGQIPYRTRTLDLPNSMNLSQYFGHEAEFEQIVEHHRRQHQGYQTVHALPFFCVVIPTSVFHLLGPLDEGFGSGGFEDTDYCVKAAIAGVPVRYALSSYVLHFQGKSTWRQGDTTIISDEVRAHDQERMKRFEERWGKDIAKMFVLHDQELLVQFARAREDAQVKALSEFVEGLRKR